SAIVLLCQAEDGIRDRNVTGVQTCALPISIPVVFTEVEKESVQEWLVSFEQLEERLATLQEALQKLENELNLKNQQLDQIEAVMWDNETLKSVEEELTEGETE